MRPHKPFIAIDLGGTVEDTWPEKRAWFASRGIGLVSYPLSRIDIIERAGVTDALYLEMVASVYSDDHILRHAVVPGCYEALTVISLHFRIAVLSSRTESQRDVTVNWLRQNALLHLIDDLALIGSRENKMSWCRSRDVSILIDDDIRHLEPENREASLCRIHYTGYPAQSLRSDHQILEASDWADISGLVVKVSTQTCA
jgi:hypothetical protein